MRKCIFFILVLSVCLASCNQDNMNDLFESNNEFKGNNEMLPEKISLLDEVYLKEPDAYFLRPFAKAFYNAMEESPVLREMIKTKALERFNKEYDVLYQFIKDEPVENGLTVRKLLLKHFESAEKLAAIEAKHPTLTIFVPQLPEDCFSAENWNTAEQIPAVAIHSTKQRHTCVISKYGFFDENSDEFVVESGFVPAFPVVVLKDNSRVVVSQNQRSQYESLNNKNSDYVFDFTNEFFDRSKEEEEASSLRSSIYMGNFDPELVDAYEIYKNVDGWHRDYVYYGIKPATPNGPLNRNFQETIIGFHFSTNVTPEQMLWWLTDPATNSGGPTLLPVVIGSTADPWTEGQWAFSVAVQTGSKLTTATITKTILAYPKELFSVTYKLIAGSFYKPQVDGFIVKNLNLNLMCWDLENYAAEIKITIEKVNPSTTISSTISSTSESAGNVSMDFKSGLKFGTSAKKTWTTAYTIQTQVGNKNMGDVLVHFGDKVILNKVFNPPLPGISPIWELRNYDSGLYSIMLAPRKVQ